MLDHRQEFTDVCAAELDEIAERRRALTLPPPPRADAARSNLGGLVGIALSGGGIRSATFSLGVLQALAEHRLLRLADYLSTVSGGGFIGSAVSSLLNEPGTSPDAVPEAAQAEAQPFPLRWRSGEPDTPAVRHLRNSENYLAPGGFVERMRIPALMIRGILLNLLFLCPYLLLAVGATELLLYWDAESLPATVARSLGWAAGFFAVVWLVSLALAMTCLIRARRAARRGDGQAERLELLAHRGFMTTITAAVLLVLSAGLGLIRAAELPVSLFTVLPAAAPIIFLVLVVTYPVASRRVVRGGWEMRNRYEASMTFSFLAAVGSLALWPLFALVADAVWLTPADLWEMLQRVFSITWWLAGLGVALLVAVACALVPAVARAAQRAALLAAAAAPLLVVVAYLVLCVFLIDPPYADQSLGEVSNANLTARDVQALNERTVPQSVAGMKRPGSDDVLGVTAVSKVIEPDHAWRLDAASRSIIMSASADLTQGTVIRIWATKPEGEMLTMGDRLLLGLAVAWLLFNAVFFNVNISSAHGFYRDRISRAYLIRQRRQSGDIVSTDRQKLSELNRRGTTAPYHLINVALDLNGTTDVNVRGRNCDFFMFSRHYTGGRRTGYCRTPDLERAHPHLDLGTAVAISGAAASPNAGVATVKQLVTLMTLLNVRLGYWLPNPAFISDASGFGRVWRRLQLRLGPGPSYLWREALGQVDSRGPFVNLSDGGHIENLAIYQLLRRRCRLIIAVDGEQDPALRFDGLLRLVLYARIDLGINVEVDLSRLRAGDNRLSQAHCIAARIDYGDAEEGWLLYLKASMTGDEDENMRDYRVSHPEFPHEPTSDQFFDERQFEMYRALGFHIGTSAVEQITGAGPQPGLGDEGFATIRHFLARELLWTPSAADAGRAVRPGPAYA